MCNIDGKDYIDAASGWTDIYVPNTPAGQAPMYKRRIKKGRGMTNAGGSGRPGSDMYKIERHQSSRLESTLMIKTRS